MIPLMTSFFSVTLIKKSFLKQAVATNMNQIELVPSGMAPPPLTVMSLSLRTVVNSRSQQVEIVAAACLVHHQFHVDKAAPQPPFQQHFCSKWLVYLFA